MGRAGRAAGAGERWASAAVLLALAVIAAVIVCKQARYDPAIFAVPAVSAPAPGPADLAAFIPEGMAPLSAAETFDEESLFEKIDGKAELYLSAGFVSLRCQRFAAPAAKDAWVEALVYDMGETRRAFAVYSMQRRAGARRLDLCAHGYLAEGALFFARGPYYVEIIPAAASPAVEEAMRSFTRAFVRAVPAGEEGFEEARLFPAEGIEPESLTLLFSNAFGFEGLDDVFTARYALGGERATAFLSLRASAAEAERLAGAYHAFLVENGGTDAGPGAAVPGLRLANVLGRFEAVFARGRAVAGVHGAPGRERAEALAARLDGRLREVGP